MMRNPLFRPQWSICQRVSNKHTSSSGNFRSCFLVQSWVISSPEIVASLFMLELGAKVQENLWVLILDMKNKLIAKEELYVGSLNASTVRIGELFRGAIQRHAASIILIHNHPSGDPTPSAEDLAMTRAAVQAGKLLDIAVLDHIVIGQGRYQSIKTLQGSLFPG